MVAIIRSKTFVALMLVIVFSVPVIWAGYVVNGKYMAGPRVTEKNYISEYLLSGESEDMGIDGATTPTTFSYTPPAGQCVYAGRIMIFLLAGSNFSPEKFANITALTNGISICANGEEIENWKTNVDVATTMYDIIPGDALGTGKAILGRWSFHRASGKASDGLRILPDAGGISIVIQDDLSAAGLTFCAKIQGVLESR